MSEELKHFFEKLKDTQDFFLFWRLYNNPSSVMGSNQDNDESEAEYYDLYDYFNLMMNNNLTEFICLILGDDDFFKKASAQTWRKFAWFLYDSIEFKKNHSLFDNHDLMLLFKEEMTVSEYFNQHGHSTLISIIAKYEIYKKYSRLHEHGYSKKQIDDYDLEKANYIRGLVNLKLTVIKEAKAKQTNKENVLKTIENDDYSGCVNLTNGYLYRHRLLNDFINPFALFPGISLKVFDELVCENRFLDIIEYKLDCGLISGIPLDNALDIIEMGISIKNGEINYELAERLNSKLLMEFDLKHAENLVSRIKSYRINTAKSLGNVIQFPKH